MYISLIEVKNYRALCDISLPLSKFCCLIGENNTGKSSLLQTLILLIKGTKLSDQDYYDSSADIAIKAQLSDISEEDLSVLLEEHRERIRGLVQNRQITLIRRYSPDKDSKLNCIRKVPKEDRFREEKISELFKGKTGKQVENTLKDQFPELGSISGGVTTQKAAREIIDKYIAESSNVEFEERESPLPTGIENSIKALLPETVYIPAVKDILDDIKTKESTSFGKLLSILLTVIEPQLSEAKETFESLDKKLNKIADDAGNLSDNRIKHVIEIEETVQKYVRETFPNVSVDIKIPPPEIKTILSNARIQVDDGVAGPVEYQGDGFKRTITFAIMRSYLELARKPEWQKDSTKAQAPLGKYIFLFEEPELYLHPKSQRILFNALAQLSDVHQILISTHSPLFFSAELTKTFVKMVKRPQSGSRPKPFAEALPIDVCDISRRDQFQLISFETTNAAFFANSVVLVEGDSDLIVYPHLSKLLHAEWNFESCGLALVKVNGKGSFRRFREFFKRFETRISIITDLDAIISDFDKLGADEETSTLRSELLRMIDKAIEADAKVPQPTLKLLKESLQDSRQKELYDKLCEARKEYDGGKCPPETLAAIAQEFFQLERTNPRIEMLRTTQDETIVRLRRVLITKLREQDIIVLDKGNIESYYPPGITGPDKPSKAQNLCKLIKTKDDVINLCGRLPVGDGSITMPEFETVFQRIFSNENIKYGA